MYVIIIKVNKEDSKTSELYFVYLVVIVCKLRDYVIDVRHVFWWTLSNVDICMNVGVECHLLWSL